MVAVSVLLLLASEAAPSTLEMDIQGLRNARGVVHACLTRDPRHFPDCTGDPEAIRLTVPAATRQIRFSGFVPGRYAVALVHDENANRKLDTFAGIPREGFGFSRNPIVRFAAPRFEKVSIDVAPGFARASVRMQYVL